MHNLPAILLCNVFGIALFSWWYLPIGRDFWFTVDSNIFMFFNHLLTQSQAFLYLVAFTNLRPFDAVAFLAMLGIYVYHYRKLDTAGRRWLLCMGAAMLVGAVFDKVFTETLSHVLGLERASATKYLTAAGWDVSRVSELSGLPCKDWSSSSFPGDHGMFLLIFVCFAARYLGRRAGLAALAVFIVFSLPRIMSGAHWFTDVAVGSVSAISILMSWYLLTPAADTVIHYFAQHGSRLLDKIVK